MESMWSPKMLHGVAIDLFAFIMTIGRRCPLAYGRASAMYRSPCDEVAVKALAPTALMPMAHDIALCSDSTCINSDLRDPSSTNSESLSTTIVCGVIG